MTTRGDQPIADESRRAHGLKTRRTHELPHGTSFQPVRLIRNVDRYVVPTLAALSIFAATFSVAQWAVSNGASNQRYNPNAGGSSSVRYGSRPYSSRPYSSRPAAPKASS